MTRDQIQAAVLGVITEVAPEIDGAAIVPGKSLRRQVDLDSADWLNVLVGLQQALGVEISDADAARLATLDMLVDHVLAARGGA